MDVREEVSLAGGATFVGGSSWALRPFQSSARALFLVPLEDGELGAHAASPVSVPSEAGRGASARGCVADEYGAVAVALDLDSQVRALRLFLHALNAYAIVFFNMPAHAFKDAVAQSDGVVRASELPNLDSGGEVCV